MAGVSDRILAFGFGNSEMRARGFTLDGTSLVPLPGGARPYAHPAGTWGTRDPSVARVGGRYVMASTRASLANYLGPNDSLSIATSDTLTSWRHALDLGSGVPGTTRCWAPEWFCDPDGRVFLYYSVSTESDPWNNSVIGFNIYARQMDPVTLQPLSAPAKMEGLTGGLTPRVIDANVTRIGNRYVMFVKDERDMVIMRAWADSPWGPWTYDRWGGWLGITGPAEGPELIKVPWGWRLFYDCYTRAGGGQLCFRDSGDLDTWSQEIVLSYAPADLRHLGIYVASAGEWVAFRSQPRRATVWVDRTVKQKIASVTGPVPIEFDASVDDPDIWSPANRTRLYAPESGTYELKFEVVWQANAAGQRSLPYRIGTGPWRWICSQNATGGGFGTEQTAVAGGVSMAAGQYVEIGTYHNAGVALEINGGAATLSRQRG